MKTAVEWIIEKILKSNVEKALFQDEINQAKEMEKEQMFAYTKEKQVIGENSMKFFKEDFEQYYNKTYKR